MLQFAAVVIFLVGLAHSLLGERFILVRLFRRENLPKLFGGTEFTTKTLRFAWHLTTIVWWAFAVLLWQLESGPLSSAFVLKVIGYSSIASGLLPLVMTRGKHLVWILFFLVGGIALFKAAA